ncbi:vanadium-dependent haloperoxidase [Winogradskyella bathintestinalis]|uniref:Vanadium-dependent haloperoxidase n=1 Tax=Winogradskyella bathintestinalis TaxID=3035208 RepID=A0ABT7ZWY6_9FLAO|nr:vanadium-dependent haloperoxidase [Winogradskyella bathintestinalis]MDN3493521.1 vanadium-dependent haloperoxidase [Winogradskyella bathintestinalis]
MKTPQYFSLLLVLFLFFNSCQKDESIVVESLEMHNVIDKIIDIMVEDIFSPPVASRIMAYPNIAAYEIIAIQNPNYTSLNGQVSDLKPIPEPISPLVNYKLSALIAHIEVSKTLVYSKDLLNKYTDSLYDNWSSINEKEFVASKEYGQRVASHINNWKDTDGYKEIRSMTNYKVDYNDPSRWRKTPPSFIEGIEPHWNKLRPFVLDSASQFMPIPPPTFSMDEGSVFFKQVKEIYDISNEITARGDDSEEIKIAQFWDCNPFVTVTRGHLMFSVKKISPGAHWMGICMIACVKTGANFDKTVFSYAKTSIAIADAFISCWDEKYRSNLIRPVSVINQYIDESWVPILQTPPFPEYTSGHSVISGSASKVLASIFGNDFEFDDTTELKFGLPIRHYASFQEAADEAAMSRMYGGIHYRAAVEEGIKQGSDLGAFVVDNLKMKD